MMLEASSAPSMTDCHAGVAKPPVHSDVAGHDHMPMPNIDNPPSPASDHHGQAQTSGCPLANIAAFTTLPNELTIVSGSTRFSPTAPQELIATAVEPPDPPPRHNS
jgi:hypothetical protein